MPDATAYQPHKAHPRWHRRLACATVALAAASPALAILTPPPSLPSLPRPPIVQHLLLESPLPLAIALLTAGAIAAIAFHRRARTKHAGLAAGGALLATAALLALAALVETPRERVIERTRLLVDAVARADARALDDMLAADCLVTFDRAPGGWEKPETINWIADNLRGRYTVSQHEVTGVQAQIGPQRGLARTRPSVRVTPDITGRPHGFVCLITWREDPDGAWRALRIEPLWLQGYGDLTPR
ncbi:MAG TPA: hypothetical protein PLU35_02550 [Phycisphaerales bacterium]|nr:hypothetical protein [Phycisphaerales bacterium]